ncbi:hypothetical protein H0E87_031207, partial [Populus deltoides]
RGERLTGRSERGEVRGAETAKGWKYWSVICGRSYRLGGLLLWAATGEGKTAVGGVGGQPRGRWGLLSLSSGSVAVVDGDGEIGEDKQLVS